MNDITELYSDYLIASFGLTTATGLSQLLDGEISHDKITRFLAGQKKTNQDLWLFVKALVRQVQSNDGVLIIDDSIEEKPYTDENDIIAWHYDHSKQINVKGINFLTLLYQSGALALPVGFELVAKTEFYIDKKTNKEKRRSPISKNALGATVNQSGNQKSNSARAFVCSMSGLRAQKICNLSNKKNKRILFVR